MQIPDVSAFDKKVFQAIQKFEGLNSAASISKIKPNIIITPEKFSVAVSAVNNKELIKKSNSLEINNDQIQITTNFNRKSSSIEKSLFVQYPDSNYYFNALLNSTGLSGYSPVDSEFKPFKNDAVKINGRWWLVYDNGTDLITYNHSSEEKSSVKMTEWIYARRPNSIQGSRYNWTFSSIGHQLRLKELNDGRIGLYQDFILKNNTKDDDGEGQKLVEDIESINHKTQIIREPLTAILEPVIYWTNDGLKREGRYEISGPHTLTVAIDESSQNYPLVIDPTINFGDWIGSKQGQAVSVTALAIEAGGSELYAGGNADSYFQMSVSMYGTYTGAQEAFVVEIAGTGEVSWLQWLGGTGNDYMNALAVTGNEIYAGGYSKSSSSWEDTAGAVNGTYNVNNPNDEGWVVEIGDNSPTSINWINWFGGSSTDAIYAVALNLTAADEIYAGGASLGLVSFETRTGNSNGTFYGGAGTDGFIVELVDGSPATIDWIQWVGAGGVEEITAIAVTADEIYAGGNASGATTSWAAIGGNSNGTFWNAAGSDGFVVEIADGATPSITWIEKLGGKGNDVLKALAVDGAEIYAGGYSESSTTSWTNLDTHSGGTAVGPSEGWVVEITDAATPSMNWIQWLGGDGDDRVNFMLTISANEVYAGGYSSASTSKWDTVVSTIGTADVFEGWIVEILDTSSPPTINWLQWLGGTGTDQVLALAQTGNEIFAGGFSVSSTAGFEAFAATVYSADGQQGFVVDIADAATPTTATFLSWVGGFEGTTTINSLAVNGDEIYAGGNADASIISTFPTNGSFSGSSENFVIEIADGATPTVNWLQWLGSNGVEGTLSLAVTGDEIYAGGWSEHPYANTNWETALIIAGTYNNLSEGWVVEIADGATPSLNWRFWLGGTNNDLLTALAVTGDEIYAAGYTNGFSNTWDTANFIVGTFYANTIAGGGDEGWVIEIDDADFPFSPDLDWLHWLGGHGNDYATALAVTGEEIFVGGYTNVTSNSMEGTDLAGGTFGGGKEGWVVAITDGGPPSIAWLQWLGGGADDAVNALAFNGNEIYAGGYTSSSTASWDTVSVSVGTYVGKVSGFVVELADTVPPTIQWRQWLGGSDAVDDDNFVRTLAVSGNEIYAGGFSISSDQWPTAMYQDGTFNNPGTFSDGWVVEIKDSSPPELSWRQWLGGDSTDEVNALTVVGDEIYAAGLTLSTANWETPLSAMDSMLEVGYFLEMKDKNHRIMLIH